MATDKGEPTPPRLTDTHRLETALNRLKNATVGFYTARANLHDAKETFASADKELAEARVDVQMLTRPNDNADIPWPWRENLGNREPDPMLPEPSIVKLPRG